LGRLPAVSSPDTPANEPGQARTKSWPRLLSGALWVGVVVLITATTWSPLIANHPAYPLLLLGTLVVGAVLLLTGRVAGKASSRLATIGRWAGFVAAAGVAALLVWLRPLAAEPVAIAAMESDSAVSVTESRTELRFQPEAQTGANLAFYPGALVDPRAYSVLARKLAEAGHQVVVLKCPLDLALLCGGAAERVAGDGQWVVGGHSLGGTEAARDAVGVPGFAGLLLWASYPLSDVSSIEFPVASVSGSNDALTTPSDIEDSRELLPSDTVFTRVEGAVHSYFGDYGKQPGDGEPTITREQAQEEIVAASLALLAASAG
jgi:pimeloyl-ACP methyl ester carboxylesterase